MRGETGAEKTPAAPINQCTNTKPIIGGSESTEGAEPSGGSGIKWRDPVLGARQAAVYRLEIKVGSSPVLHAPLPHPPPPISPLAATPRGVAGVVK